MIGGTKVLGKPRPSTDQFIGKFVDTGCQYHPSCLNCPEPVCLEDKPTVKIGMAVKERRVNRVERAHNLRQQGVRVKAIAEELGVGVSTVEKYLREMR